MQCRISTGTVDYQLSCVRYHKYQDMKMGEGLFRRVPGQESDVKLPLRMFGRLKTFSSLLLVLGLGTGWWKYQSRLLITHRSHYENDISNIDCHQIPVQCSDKVGVLRWCEREEENYVCRYHIISYNERKFYIVGPSGASCPHITAGKENQRVTERNTKFV